MRVTTVDVTLADNLVFGRILLLPKKCGCALHDLLDIDATLDSEMIG